METMTFVLGALCGLFLAGIVYAFVGVLKMTRKNRDLQDRIESLRNEIENVCRTLESKTNEISQEAEKKFAELSHHFENIAEDINRRHEEITRYVDSRIDKTIDNLSKLQKELKS